MCRTPVIFGHRHCGKTTLGKEVADSLGLLWVDTDKEIEKKFSNQHSYPLSCKEIYLKYGQEFFRNLERQVIQNIYPRDHLIVTVGAGALLKAESFLHFEKDFELLWLWESYPTLLERGKTNPPAYINPDKFEEEFKKEFDKRNAFFISLKKPPLSSLSIKKLIENDSKGLKTTF